MSDSLEYQPNTEVLLPNGEKPRDSVDVISYEYAETADEAELRSLIFGLDDTVEVLLDIPEWKFKDKSGKERIVQVLVRALNAEERVQYIKVMQQSNLDLKRLYADLAISTARHPQTKQLIWKTADRDAIMRKHGMAIERIAMLASEISGLSEAALKTIRKN